MNYNINNLGVDSLANKLFPPQNNTPVEQPTAPVVYGTPSVGPMSYGTPNSGLSFGTSSSWTPAPAVVQTTPSTPGTYKGIRITPGTDAEIAAQVARINAGSGANNANGVPQGGGPLNPAPGSAGSLPGSNLYTMPIDPYEAERNRLMGIVGDTSQNTDPNSIYRDKLREYQSQIDAIDNIYNDQLTNSRIVNAPTYKARLDQNRIGQVMGGLVASPMGAAQTTNIETANQQEQAAAEALIQEKRAQELAAIHGQIRKDSSDILAANKLAKTKGAEAMLEFYNVTKPAMRAKQVSNAVKALVSKGVDITKLTPEEINSYTSALGVTKDELISAYTDAKKASDKEAADIKAEAYKNLPESAKEYSYLQTLTPEQQKLYKQYQTEDANRKAKAAGGSNSTTPEWQYKIAGTQALGDAINKSVDQNGKLTPAQYKKFKSNFISSGLGNAKDFDANYAQHVYLNSKDRTFKYTPESYGISSK